jgi:DNA polymerase
MSDPTKELMLEALGLLPLWVRHELLDAEAGRASQPANSVQAAAALAPMSPNTPSAPAAPTRPPVASPPPARSDVANPSPPELADRAQAIARMDWSELQTAVTTCTACGLCKTRGKTVFGVGKPQADWLVVGEAPDADEDRQGEPFVGPAGKLLDAMLASVNRSRSENAFILNTPKCRPPQNRNPNPDELALCAPFLHRQVELIKPKVIFAVGRFAAQTLLEREATISSLRGQVHDYRGIPVVVSYHPAYLLRNTADKVKAWQDLLQAKKLLADRG